VEPSFGPTYPTRVIFLGGVNQVAQVREHGRMRLAGEWVVAPRLLLLGKVEFEPGCVVFGLEHPLWLRIGDRL
jgi:hypothetical protein